MRLPLIARLLIGVVAAFGFGFALVPLYDVFCDITGLGGRTNETAVKVVDSTPDTSRSVRVRFIATLGDGTVWQFSPVDDFVDVHPGEVRKVAFSARNPLDQASVGRAIPSVVPLQAARYLQKTECFCFQEQRLEAGQAIEYPMVFQIDKSLPDYYDTITLNYTLYNEGLDAVGAAPAAGASR
ncbi:MAG: cytochrome c oxidase assembly protein [Gammaproteobacteria bacterium AqS3]|nr:cytochrome c oxidase assembly protein [Gammaproteobacteria bacterium AqS3]